MQTPPKFKRNLAREGKVDVRRDEDQNEKLTQAIKLLIEAGYFRARVKGLSPFDKIVGGMTWCIEMCNYDIDVDLLFHESLTIGRKIALTEKIVQVLPLMKCPYCIEPHQIQGLDTRHILPVIEWLVTQALETKDEYQEEMRLIALNEFDRHYGPTLNQTARDENLKIIKHLNDIKNIYGPKRKFKSEKDVIENSTERHMMTLLEYSENLDDQHFKDNYDTESIDEEDMKIHSKLCQEMIPNAKIAKHVNSEVVSDILGKQAPGLMPSAEKYNQFQRKEISSTSESLCFALEKQIHNLEKDKEDKLGCLKLITSREDELRHKTQELEEKFENVNENIKEFQNINYLQNHVLMNKFSDLIEANEKLKKSSSQFKEKCLKEAELLRQSIKDINNAIGVEKDIVSEDLFQSRNVEVARLKQVKVLLSEKTKAVESLKRIIDDVPGRAELFQYQKRFIELYDLIGAEHHETQQFYNMYNTLADSLAYMKKEYDLLNSILDNMEQGLLPSSMEEYINQLKVIIDGITQNKIQLENRRGEEKMKRATLSDEVHRLQDLQIHYARLLHLFSQEIATNEMLLETC
ncbi:UNVERIFIED_CONTAM: hypothetical protein RMT77_006029 [Armadillidium vulgare]